MEDQWKGQEVWILGGGNSLPIQLGVPQHIIGKKQPKDYIPYMEQLKDKNVIGVNAAYVLGKDIVDVCFFGDDKFWDNHKQNLIASKIPLVSIARQFEKSSEVTYIQRDRKKKLGISVDGTLCWNANSGAAAINLAVLMGASRICLLGFDMHDNGGSHWHNYYPANTSKPYTKHLSGFPAIAEDLKQLGIDIINYSPDTAIKDIPVGDLRQSSIQRKQKAAVRVCAVTPSSCKERKPFLDFCKKRISEQTYKVEKHIVIDYPNETNKSDLAKRYKQGIREAFAEGFDLVLFIEDDDYYAKTYVEEMVQRWEDAGRPVLIGARETRYYHLFNQGSWVKDLKSRASCHATAVAPGVNYLVGADDVIGYDVKLWQANRKLSKTIDMLNPCISIKHGIGQCAGIGHNTLHYDKHDTHYETLKTWVDDEAFEFYMELIKEFTKEPKSICKEEILEIKSKAYAINRINEKQSNDITHIYNKVTSLVGNNSILEIGCATGMFAKFCFKNKINYLTGCDFLVDKAKELNLHHEDVFNKLDATVLASNKANMIVLFGNFSNMEYKEMIRYIPSGQPIILALYSDSKQSFGSIRAMFPMVKRIRKIMPVDVTGGVHYIITAIK